ncbi:MAG: PrgI family protein [Lachnospiraceae bacterium]|nr:PrgI family protein [Lachnospiraceae bacterium]
MIKKPIPKDLSKIKSKVLFNLTKRQLACFTPAVLTGVPLFFLARNAVGNTAATLCMMLVMMPFFLLAMYEHNGQPLEKYLKNMIFAKFIRDPDRPYRTNNYYTLLEKKAKIREEVRMIVFRKKKE